MSVTEFKRLLESCRTQREAEHLMLSQWGCVVGTLADLQVLRDEFLARLDALGEDGAEIGARGGGNAEAVA